jgi:hypothetical protein
MFRIPPSEGLPKPTAANDVLAMDKRLMRHPKSITASCSAQSPILLGRPVELSNNEREDLTCLCSLQFAGQWRRYDFVTVSSSPRFNTPELSCIRTPASDNEITRDDILSTF